TGEIRSITFSRGVDYLLVPNGCASSSCASIGTYRIDGDSLVLDDAKTGEERRLALEVMKTSEPQPLVKSVRPRDLVQPGQQLEQPGQQTTTGNGQQLATSGNQLDGKQQQLLQIIQQALMNAQQMNRDNGGGGGGNNNNNAQPQPQPNDKPKIDCKADVP